MDWDQDGLLAYNEFLQSVRPVPSWSYLPNTSYECKKYLTQANTYQSPARELDTPRAWYYDTDVPELAGDGLGVIIEEEPSVREGPRLFSTATKNKHPSVSRMCYSSHKPIEKGEWDKPRSFVEQNKFGAFKTKKLIKSGSTEKVKFKWEQTLRADEFGPVGPPKSEKKKRTKKKPKKVDSGLELQDETLTKEKSPFKKLGKSKANPQSRSKTESKWVKKSQKDLAADTEPPTEEEISPVKSRPEEENSEPEIGPEKSHPSDAEEIKFDSQKESSQETSEFVIFLLG